MDKVYLCRGWIRLQIVTGEGIAIGVRAAIGHRSAIGQSDRLLILRTPEEPRLKPAEVRNDGAFVHIAAWLPPRSSLLAVGRRSLSNQEREKHRHYSRNTA